MPAEEFCERLLPGSFKLQDVLPVGGTTMDTLVPRAISAKDGRLVNGMECDRFDRCQERVYELISPEERARGVKPDCRARSS